MTKLIEKRNSKFTDAVNELLVASAAQVCHRFAKFAFFLYRLNFCELLQDQDPTQLLLDATLDHVPVHPDTAESVQPLRERRAELDFYLRNPDNRPSIESLLNEIKEEDFYRDQIVPGGHRIIDARQASFGTAVMGYFFACLPALLTWETRRALRTYFTAHNGCTLRDGEDKSTLRSPVRSHQQPLQGTQRDRVDIHVFRKISHLPDPSPPLFRARSREYGTLYFPDQSSCARSETCSCRTSLVLRWSLGRQDRHVRWRYTARRQRLHS
jgi:hypothetical protein